MYIVSNYKVKYWVFCWDGDIRGPYDSFEEFNKYWSIRYRHDGHNFGTDFEHCTYVLKNEFGDIVSPEEVSRHIYQKRKDFNMMYQRTPGAKRGGWNMFRSFGNATRNRRWHKVHDEELGIKSRHKYIPNTYDDIYKSRIGDDNWKQYRKNQWKDSKKQ